MNLELSTNEYLEMLLVAFIFIVESSLFAVGKVESLTYYIKPHRHSSCPAVPCVTLSDYAAQSNLTATPQNTSLVFLAGMHTLDQSVYVETFMYYAMIGDSSSLPQLKSVITCSGNVGFHFKNKSNVQIQSMAFHSCGVEGQSNIAIIQVHYSNMKIMSSSFQYNILNSTLLLFCSKVLICNCSFTDNIANGVYSKGGAFKSFKSSITFTGSNSFVNNTAYSHGGAIAAWNCNITMMATNGQPAYYTAYASMSMIPQEASNSFFSNKIISNFIATGVAISTYSCFLSFSGKLMADGNLALPNVSDMDLTYSRFDDHPSLFVATTLDIVDSTLTLVNGNLSVTQSIGDISISSSAVLINESSIISHNNDVYDAAIDLYYSVLTIWGSSLIEDNKSPSAGGLFLSSSTAMFINSTISASTNSSWEAGLTLFETTLMAKGTTLLFKGNETRGYGIRSHGSTLTLQENCIIICSNVGALDNESITLYNSNATFVDMMITLIGGRMTLSYSTVLINGTTTFRKNFGVTGGAISLDKSMLTLQGNCIIEDNKAEFFGGGISLWQSTLILAELTINVTANSASLGGGFYLGLNSKQPPLQLQATHNKAEKGAAIFVQDFCFTMKQNSECFFQILSPRLEQLGENVSFTFTGNTASVAGNDLYGGMLDDCELNHQSKENALNTFLSVSSFNGTLESKSSSISSDPYSVCFCTNNSVDCKTFSEKVEVQRGQAFTVPLVATGQGHGIIQAVIRTQFKSVNLRHTGLAENQAIQQGGRKCLPLNYTVFSAEDNVELTVFAEGPCRDLGKASRIIQVHLLPCPLGFQLSSGKCICHPKIQPYTNTCFVEWGMIKRSENWWISTVYSNGSLEGFVTYPHCPFDYCTQNTILLSLVHPDDQCALKRSGRLCGACQQGHSLTLGGSACSECSNKNLPAMLLLFIVAGIVLIFSLLLLQLHVAKGTINGLVFYANIVSINKAVFFPAKHQNILTVFLSWLSLDFGITACLFNGLDMYAKVWLQFAFPIYIWLLLIILIIGCHYSTKISRLFGKNPVACLSTLILLSYTKLLQNVITILAFAIILYPNGTHQVVWLHDANIAYLQGKHIPLFLVAVCVLLFLFMPYTLLLTAGQWIQAKSNWRVLRPLNSLYLRPFFDAYYAPFKPQHRYWPGGMLLLRLILLLVFSLNSSGNTSYNLLVISTSMFGLCNMRILTGKVYRHWALELLEISFLLNLGVLSVSTHHVALSEGNQAALVYTSVGLAFVEFVGIILYHSYIQLRELVIWKKLFRIFNTRYYNHNEEEDMAADDVEMQAALSVAPTPTTCVNLREPLLDDDNLNP